MYHLGEKHDILDKNMTSWPFLKQKITEKSLKNLVFNFFYNKYFLNIEQRCQKAPALATLLPRQRTQWHHCQGRLGSVVPSLTKVKMG